MKGLIASALPMFLLLAPTVAQACLPPAIEFSFGSARLDDRALLEIGYVAREYRTSAGPNWRVRLVAQTDGSAANVRMSRRRVQSVKAALVRRGVPARAIVIGTRDPSQPMIVGEGYARYVVIEFASAARTGTTESGGCS